LAPRETANSTALFATIARDAIRDLVARYNSFGDAGRFEQLLQLFGADAVMETYTLDGSSSRYDGIEAIATLFLGAQERFRSEPTIGGYIRHFTSTHQIDILPESCATGRLYFAVLAPHGLDHWGRYVDRYSVVDDEWRFSERKVYVEGSSPSGTFED